MGSGPPSERSCRNKAAIVTTLREKNLRVEVSHYAVPNIWHWQTLFFLPSVLSKKLVLKLFQVLANPLLLLSRLLELLYKFLPVGWGEMFFKCLTLKYTQTSSIYKKNPQKSTTLARFLFFLYYTGHTGGRQLVSKQIKSVLDWLKLLCNTMAKVCKQPLADKHFAINLNGCALSVMFLCNMGLDLIRCQMVVSWLYSYIKGKVTGQLCLEEFLNLCSGWISVYVDSDRSAIFAELSGLILSNRPKSVTNWQ